MALKAMAFEEFAFGRAVAIIAQRLVDFEVITPARKLDSVVAKLLGHASHLLELQVSPLASEKGHGSCH